MITFSRVDPSFSLVEAAPASPTDAMAMTASQYNVYQLYPKAQEQRFKKKNSSFASRDGSQQVFQFFGLDFSRVFARLSSLTVKTRERGGGGRVAGKPGRAIASGGGGGGNQKGEPSTLEALVEGLRRRVGKDKDSILGIISCFFSRQEFRPRILITHLTLVVGAGGCQGYRSCERETNRL